MFFHKLASRRPPSISIQEPAHCPAYFSVLGLVLLLALLTPLTAHAQQEWTWVSGAQADDEPGVYAANGVPGAREGSQTWIDSSGNLWFFGGYGYDSSI
jgi:hypothetical protein